KEFPDGKFAKVAKTRIENLVAKANARQDDPADVSSKTLAVAADEPAADDDQAAADSEPAVQEEAQADDGQRQPDEDAAAVTAQSDEPPAGGADWEQEYALWKAASDGNTVTEYEAYLKAYPNGKFAAIAQARVVQLAAAEQPD